MQQENTTRTSSASISAAIVAANAGTHPTLHSPLHSSGDSARSLADMAQTDLDAALQLLADRAQYITGANGAAIALRRGRNDMQCRATTGSNAPELGALLSTESGLSGESVRTRQALRCDDAERDPRVNREGCRQLGIASVVVMPVVNDDEVLGVFELFSGKVNAFGERDLSALQRLSEMVETAVKLARAAQDVPGLLAELPVGADHPTDTDAAVFVAGEFVADEEADEPVLEVEGPTGIPAEPVLESAMAVIAPAASDAPSTVSEVTSPPVAEVATGSADAGAARKTLFWSAAMASAADGPAEPDRSHVPPILRNLRTCEVCGFPVSPGRALCVECEEKRWRGQLRRPPTPLPSLSEKKAAPAPALVAPASAPVARLVAAAAASGASAGSVSSPAKPADQAAAVDVQAKAVQARAVIAGNDPILAKPALAKPVSAANPPARTVTPEPATQTVKLSPPTLVLSAAQPSPSWIAANKYILGALLVVAATVAAILFLR